MNVNDYFLNDNYWSMCIDKELQEDMWIEKYKEYFKTKGKCLDLGCGIGQYSKQFIKYGYDVTSADISSIALSKVKEFNKNIVKLDMRKKLPFKDNEFDLVFANLSIHYFSNKDTINLITQISRILKKNGLFIRSVNAIQILKNMEDEAKEVEYHLYEYKDKLIRLFDINDIKSYLAYFNILKIEEREIIRFDHKKNYIAFIAKKE